uniref:UPAR/Ly6 domain-containing protein n=1 Tax=Myripristis murdjan TaxID=586833 RepID=A0A668AM26_9TELE
MSFPLLCLFFQFTSSFHFNIKPHFYFAVQQMGSSLLINTKSCVPPSLCDVGNGTFSGSLGFMRVVGSVRCCDTDNCNSQTLPIPADQESNGFECYSCDSSTCRHKIQCVGSSCGFSELDSMIIPGFNFTDGPTCCEGNFCNSVSTTRLSVFPLLLGLISLIFIY